MSISLARKKGRATRSPVSLFKRQRLLEIFPTVAFRHYSSRTLECFSGPHLSGEDQKMKKLVLALVLVVAGVSLGGCFVGKSPAPVITKG